MFIYLFKELGYLLDIRLLIFFPLFSHIVSWRSPDIANLKIFYHASTNRKRMIIFAGWFALKKGFSFSAGDELLVSSSPITLLLVV